MAYGSIKANTITTETGVVNVADFVTNDATPSSRGIMTAADKTKLDGIETGAEVNAITSVAGKTGAVTLEAADVSGVLPTTGGTVTGNITLDGDGTNDQLKLQATDGSIELSREGGGAYIDFKNDKTEDYDVRISSQGTSRLDVTGSFQVTSDISTDGVLKVNRTSVQTAALQIDGSPSSTDYQNVLNAQNDTGSAAVHFINGSGRTTDGGADTYTIRNDIGGIRLGSTSQSTTIDGSAVTFNSSQVVFGGSVIGTSEGGEIRLTSPSDQSFGDTVIDMNGTRLRFFYAASPYKGAYLDLTSLGDSVGSRILTTSDEGGGNGLDADTVDGIEASSFLRSDADDTASGTVTFNGVVNIRSAIDLADNDVLRFGSGDDAELFCNGSHLYLDLNSGIGNFYIRDGSTDRFTFDDSGLLNVSDKIHIKGDITTGSSATLQVNGFQRTGTIYLHAGNAPAAESTSITLENSSGNFAVNTNIVATGNVTAYSDINLKKNIEVIPNALGKVSEIRGVTYDRKDIEGPRQTGVIAQEIEEVLPEAVVTNDEGIKSVAYGNMIGLLIEAVKELKEQNAELKERIQTLESK